MPIGTRPRGDPSSAMEVRARVALVYSSGPLSAVPHAALHRWLESQRAHMVQPLERAGAVMQTFACLDGASRNTALPAALEAALGARVRRVWYGGTCEGLVGLGSVASCCQSGACDGDFVDCHGAKRGACQVQYQFYRLMGCHRRLLAHEANEGVGFDYYLRARLEHMWVAALPDAAGLLVQGARHVVAMRYKAACNLGDGKPLTLSHFQVRREAVCA